MIWFVVLWLSVSFFFSELAVAIFGQVGEVLLAEPIEFGLEAAHINTAGMPLYWLRQLFRSSLSDNCIKNAPKDTDT